VNTGTVKTNLLNLVSSGLYSLGIAFAYSGAAKTASSFVSLYEDTIADYEMTDDTDPGFVLFRLLCWRLFAWIETMRAAWSTACANGSSLVVSNAQAQLKAFDVSLQFKKLITQAVTLVQDVQAWKDERGSFEIDRLESSTSSNPP
jgi:hypothetical protein